MLSLDNDAAKAWKFVTAQGYTFRGTCAPATCPPLAPQKAFVPKVRHLINIKLFAALRHEGR